MISKSIDIMFKWHHRQGESFMEQHEFFYDQKGNYRKMAYEKEWVHSSLGNLTPFKFSGRQEKAEVFCF